MAGDPYAALGVSRTASAAEIKKAYRRIVKTDHPDLTQDAAATQRFKAATSAYDLLKDADQRRRFDAGEINDQGQEQGGRWRGRADAAGGGNPFGAGPGRGGADPGLSDVFADLFGHQAGARGSGFGGFGGFGGGARGDQRGHDLRMTLEVDFVTAARGGRTRITLPQGGTLDVAIPKGVREGQTIRLRGKGDPGTGRAPAGDAYLEVRVTDHPTFRREGDDIHLVLPITLDEAVLGAKVAVPTIDGPVNLTVPPGATSGQRLRLRGRGVNGGDQHVELRIAMPPKVDPDLAAFFESWRQANAYDPRRGLTG